jgi:UDP-N-acetylglucosamine transferase subunit ALG13
VTAVLVCSGGGHLKQLHALHRRFDLDEDTVWVTFDTALSRSLLAGEPVHFVPYVRPRDVVGVARVARIAHDVMRSYRAETVISTGANLAVGFLPSVFAHRATMHYIESAARALAPSMTGRVIDRIPRVVRYTQYERQASKRWSYAGSVLDAFTPGPAAGSARLDRVVVTVGTNESYGFRRLIEALLRVIPSQSEVLWQTGTTDVTGLGITGHARVPAADLARAIAEADLVISHAGMGSALTVLEAGRTPLLVPRLRRFGEHVDDHQVPTAEELARRGLCLARAATDVDEAALYAAAAGRVQAIPAPPPFALRHHRGQRKVAYA